MDCIWCETPKECLNRSLSFRFIAKEDYERTEMALSAISTFRVFLNGEFLFGGPSRTGRGYSIIHKKDLFLRKGDCLCVDVCNYRINAFFPIKEDGFFACALCLPTGEKIATSEDFSVYELTDRLEKTERMSFQRSFTEAYDACVCRSEHYLGEEIFPKLSAIKVKGNILTENQIPRCDWSTESAQAFLERGTISFDDGETPLKQFVFDRIDEQVQGYKKSDLDISLNDELLKMRYTAQKGTDEKTLQENEYFTYAFARNFTGYIQTELSVEEDCELYLTFDELLWTETYENPAFEPLNKGGALPLFFNRMHVCQAVYFRLKKGKYRLTTSELYTLKYLRFSLTKGKICLQNTPKILLCQNDGAYRLSFFVADEKLQTVYDAGVHTLAQNTQDLPTDCPGRERAGWLCDSFFIARAENLFCGENRSEENFFRCFLTEENYPYIPNGMFPMCYPADHNDGTFIPNWGMWLMLEVYDHAKRTGKREFIQLFKEKFYRCLRYFEGFENEDGLLEKLDGWVFVEWSKCNDLIGDINYPTNMLYYAILRETAKCYDDGILLEKAKKLRQTIIEKSFDGLLFRERSVKENGGYTTPADYTETCQYYAFFLGLATEKEFPQTYALAFDKATPTGEELHLEQGILHKANTFIGNILRFSYLAETERYTQLLDEITDYFYPMAIRTGTLWESRFSHCSCNHGFTAIVSEWILKAVSGIRSYQENKVQFAKPCFEGDFLLKIPTKKGDISLWQTDGKCGYDIPKEIEIKCV